MKRTLLLLLALLCMLPAAHAAGPETLYPIAYCFRETDFRAATLSDLNGIFVTSVPEADVATVCLGERVIRAGDVLPVSVLGELELLPVSTGGQEAALCYCPIRGTALGEPAQVTIRIRSAKDAAPKADDAELETYKNIPNDGRLTGSDPEDTNLTFQLAEEPKRGKVELQENGSFVYTPAKNKVGEDSFTFTVTDAAGNVSHPATVRITVKKPSECRAFADLTGSLDQFEAMWTAAAGLTGGRSIGGTLCYLPQETVSRAEFLVMAMELLDVPVDDTLQVSGFADADDAPAWLQPYLASAMRRGIVNGMVSERGLVFRPNEPVTAGQAAVMLQNLLELPVSAAVSQTDAPYWAASSMQALQALFSTQIPEAEAKQLIRDMHGDLRKGAAMSQVMKRMMDAGIRIDPAHMRRFGDLLAQLCNETRMFMNHGFTPQELMKRTG